jgi:hypothetical protein
VTIKRRIQSFLKRKSLHQQKGFALSLEVLLVAVFFGVISLKVAEFIDKRNTESKIASSAEDLAQINYAIRRVISDFYFHIDALETVTGFAGLNTPGNTVTFNGIDFLKSNAGICTTGNFPNAPVAIPSQPTKTVNVPTDGYLPCGMSGVNDFGQTYTVTFENTGTSLRAQVDVSKLQTSEPGNAGFLAEKIAQAVSSTSSGPLQLNAYWDVIANPGISVTSVNGTTYANANWGVIQVRVAAGGNVENWLRLDGTSTMAGDIDLGGNEIKDVSIINGLSNQLQVTADTQFSGANGVYIDNNISTNGMIVRDALSVQGDSLLKGVFADGEIVATGDINTGGDVIANNGRITGVQIAGQSASLGNAIYYSAIVSTDGAPASIKKPLCPVGTSPRIFAVPAYPVSSSTSTSQGYYGSFVHITDTTPWTVRVYERISTNSTAGQITTQPATGTYARAFVVTKCQ